MGNGSKNKDYLVQGTILVIASFVARVIGMIYRIPLTRILGHQGNTYYSTANEILCDYSDDFFVQPAFGGVKACLGKAA